jgi:hypothetical protein
MNWFLLVGFFALGKICIYTLQIFPPTFLLADKADSFLSCSFFGKLVRCEFCLGVWVYAFWVACLGMYPPEFYIPVISEFVFGAIASFIMHLISLGWNAKFGVIQLGGDDAV